MVTVISGDNPTQMYLDALMELVSKGQEVGPRGKLTKELRPVVLQYLNPLHRITFVEGRSVNPFFQLAESIWILAGRSDVAWLTDYNKSIAQFSDDGVYFNAPYGERLRFWGKNDAQGVVHNPIDQLKDCYEKLKADRDTRQAVAHLSDVRFDGSHVNTKDRACNISLFFKVRGGKLDLTVTNRSNDLHWGVFGANLCQFSTIQEAMASWLGLPVGTYTQFTDSLHIYLEDYGAKHTEDILTAYGLNDWDWNDGTIDSVGTTHFEFPDEPRMNSDWEQWHGIINGYFRSMDKYMSNPQTYMHTGAYVSFIDNLKACPDPYLSMVFLAMAAYQAHKAKSYDAMCLALNTMPDCSWKVSCLRFLVNSYKQNDDVMYSYRMLYDHLGEDIKSYIERKG